VLVSTLTTEDPLRLALDFAPEKPPTPQGPWYSEQIDWSRGTAGLRFEIGAPDGKKRTLEVAVDTEPPDARPAMASFSDFIPVLSIDGSRFGTLRWKQAVPDLFSKPGKYTIALGGSIKTDRRQLLVQTKPLEFEIVRADANHKSIAEIERSAAASIQKRFRLKAAPKPGALTIDDVNGERWVRFWIDEASEGYDQAVVEMRLDASGRENFVDAFTYFTCVAAGTPIETPTGEVSVEQLRVGDEVTSFDFERKQPARSRVERIDRAHAEQLIVFGQLRVTGEHPLFSDGRWTRARDVAAGARLLRSDLDTTVAEPVSVVEATTVFDIGVSPPHNYFAGGLLVHNKAVGVRLGQGEPFEGLFFRRAAKKK
jgi:hypothetical protein